MANLPQPLPFGHCIKSCILDNFGDCEKPSIHADSLGHGTSDNEGLCQPSMNILYIQIVHNN